MFFNPLHGSSWLLMVQHQEDVAIRAAPIVIGPESQNLVQRCDLAMISKAHSSAWKSR